MGQKLTVRFIPGLVARRREDLLLTLGELLKAAGVSKSAYYAALHGRPVGVRSARKLACALGADIRELIELSAAASSAVAPA